MGRLMERVVLKGISPERGDALPLFCRLLLAWKEGHIFSLIPFPGTSTYRSRHHALFSTHNAADSAHGCAVSLGCSA